MPPSATFSVAPPGPRAELHHSPTQAGRLPEKRKDMSITETLKLF